MAVIENRSTALGDGLYIQTDVPILGIATLTGFVDTTAGESATAFFTRQFRYSLDGITWSQWAELSAANLALIPIRPGDTFFAEYQYLHQGTDPAAVLTWTDTTIQGQQVDLKCGPVYSQSIFAPQFSCRDVGVLTWAISVGEKLYQRGILPEFMLRNANGDGMDDRDFLDFWLSVTTFFAFLVHFARGFERIAENNTLLQNYLLGFGLYATPDTTNTELLNLLGNLWREVGKRGTAAMFTHDGEHGRGEFLRLIDFQALDEFFWVLAEPQQTGWNVDNCSPLYRGLTPFKQVNKFYEQEINALTQLDRYPLATTGTGGVSPVLRAGADGSYGIQLTATSGTVSGLQTRTPADALAFGLPVNENCSYELKVSFQYTPLSAPAPGAIPAGALFITLACYDQQGFALTPPLADRTGPGQWMLAGFQGGRADVTYTHRGIMYAKNTPAIDSVDTASSLGHHLSFPPGTRLVVPTIVLDPTLAGAGDQLTLSAVRLTPLPDYSTGFVDTPNLMQCWLENRNTHLSLLELRQFVRRYLLPYAATLHLTALSETATIAQFPKLRFTLRTQDPSAWNLRNGVVEVKPTGGLPPYRVIWFEDPLYNGQNPLLQNLAGGAYRGVLTDSSPVPQQLPVTATLTTPTRPTAWRARAASASCQLSQ